MTKERFVHTIALSREDEIRLTELVHNHMGIMDIFRAGLEVCEDELLPEKIEKEAK